MKAKIIASVCLMSVLASSHALDLSKKSDVAQQEIYEENLLKRVNKEMLLNMMCSKAEAIQKSQKPTRGDMGSLVRFGFSVIDDQICIGQSAQTPEPDICKRQVIPLGKQIVSKSFFNSYGRNLEDNKECQDVPIRLGTGVTAIGMYHINRTSENERHALQVMEGLRRLPKACRDQTIEFMEYANKRLGECIK